jgi:uncharacterized RDD family membrane protein YckC
VTQPALGPGGGTGPSGPRAGFAPRFVALLVDGVIFWLIALVAYQVSFFLGVIVGFAQFGYFVYFEGSPSGQTVGKRAMSIRVAAEDSNGPIDYGRAAIRNLVRIVSGLACWIGYLWMLWDPEKQTWHDKVARTNVVPTSVFPVDAWPG